MIGEALALTVTLVVALMLLGGSAVAVAGGRCEPARAQCDDSGRHRRCVLQRTAVAWTPARAGAIRTMPPASATLAASALALIVECSVADTATEVEVAFTPSAALAISTSISLVILFVACEMPTEADTPTAPKD